VTYAADTQQPIAALRQVSFAMKRGEIIGVLGESGCGKSTLALSLLGLLPKDARTEGSILFREQNLFALKEPQLRKIRGAGISLIYQEPGLSLSPVMRIGSQIAEVIRAHRQYKWQRCKDEAKAILREMRLLDTDRIYNSYPHQLSGGELHRVAIAQAVCCRPDLIIADEATRSLDVTLQGELLNLFREMNRTSGTTLLFITHNPALLAGFAHRVIVMHDGTIIEEGDCTEIFCLPSHPYTQALLRMVRTSGTLVQKSLTAGAGR
jgi:ABC-type dipeptide/oligopeptide/nickel transport system ATPase component